MTTKFRVGTTCSVKDKKVVIQSLERQPFYVNDFLGSLIVALRFEVRAAEPNINHHGEKRHLGFFAHGRPSCFGTMLAVVNWVLRQVGGTPCDQHTTRSWCAAIDVSGASAGEVRHHNCDE